MSDIGTFDNRPHAAGRPTDPAKDTGMAMVLICLLLALFTGRYPVYVAAAVGLLVVNMIWPGVYRPVSRVWIGGSTLMGTVVSKILLTVIFYAVLTPIGLVRRMAGADPMQVKQWKTGAESVFKVRDVTFTADDIEKPY